MTQISKGGVGLRNNLDRQIRDKWLFMAWNLDLGYLPGFPESANLIYVATY